MSKTSKLLWGVAAVIAVLLATLSYYHIRAHDKEHAFVTFFSSKPASVKVTEYGYDCDIFGRGSYVLTFIIPESDLNKLLQQQGYKAVGINCEPNHWRMELCNEVLTGLLNTNVRIDPTFDCYSKETKLTRARIFYDKTQKVAIFMGFGRYKQEAQSKSLGM